MSIAVPREVERYPFAMGGTLIVLFVVQALTGLLLAARYVPTADGAHASVATITTVTSYGWFLRGLHGTTAGLMVAAALVHFARTFLSGAFAAPQRTTWITGVALLALVMLFGFSGYALVADANATAATAVGLRLAGPLATLAGGARELVGRMYALHVVALPLVVIGVGVAHVLLVRRHAPAPGDPDTVPFGRHVLTQAFVGLGAVTLAVGLTLLFPPLLGPAQGIVTAARPEWYFLPHYGALKILPATAAGPAMLLGLLALAAWPWLEPPLGRRSRLGPGAARAVVVLVPLLIALWEALS